MTEKKKRRPYRTKTTKLEEFNTEAEKLSQVYGILFAIERVSGFVDSLGVRHAPAYTVHVDGFAFRVADICCGVALLKGFDAGQQFRDASSGRGCVTAIEAREICIGVLKEKGLYHG